jgi:hypothetical protein
MAPEGVGHELNNRRSKVNNEDRYINDPLSSHQEDTHNLNLQNNTSNGPYASSTGFDTTKYHSQTPFEAGTADLANHEFKDHNTMGEAQSGLNDTHYDKTSTLNDGSGYQSFIPPTRDNDNHQHKRDTAPRAGVPTFAERELNNRYGKPNSRSADLSNEDASLIHPGSTHASNSYDKNDHHHKRDIALGAGTATLAGHELKDHHNNNNMQSAGVFNNTQPSSVNSPHSGSDHQMFTSASHNKNLHGHDTIPEIGVSGHGLKNHHDKNNIQSNVFSDHHSSANPLHGKSGHTSSVANPYNSDDHYNKRDITLGAGASDLASHELKDHQNKNHSQAASSTNNNQANSLHLGSDHTNHYYTHDAAGHAFKDHHNSSTEAGPLNDTHPINVNSAHTGSNHQTSGLHSLNSSSYGNNYNAALDGTATDLAGHGLMGQSGALKDAHHSKSHSLHPTSDHHQSSIPYNNDPHYKRDAALSTGTAGLVGHELKNCRDNRNIHADPLNDNIHSGDSDFNPSHSSNTDDHPSSLNKNGHHYKRDAALGAGVTGIADHKLKNYHHDNKQIPAGNANNSPAHPDRGHYHDNNHNEHGAARDASAGYGTNEHHNKERADGSVDRSVPNNSLSSVNGNGPTTDGGATAGAGSVTAVAAEANKGAAVHDKPLNTGGDAHHIAEQPPKGLGGLTGKQPVGEINFKKL